MVVAAAAPEGPADGAALPVKADKEAQPAGQRPPGAEERAGQVAKEEGAERAAAAARS